MPPTFLCRSPRCYHDPETGTLTPAEAAPGLRLCWYCRDRLAVHLGDLPTLDAALEEMLANTGPVAGGEWVSGSSTPGLPINPAVAEARDNLRGILASWAEMIVEERGITAPARTVPGIAAFLAGHVDWLAAHPAAGDADDEIGDLVHAARRAAYPHPTRRIPLDTCPADGCGGTLTAVLRTHDDTRASAIRCDVEATHTWPAEAWFTLRRQLRKQPA